MSTSPITTPFVWPVVRDREFTQIPDLQGKKVIVNLYQIIFKQTGCGNLQYGKNAYDYESGTLLFTAPGQVMTYEGEAPNEPSLSKDWRLAFHPDLIRKSELGNHISRYSFFDYDLYEALHLSKKERTTIEELLEKIVTEYGQNLDRHSQHLIIANI
jgi:hypothetical protein